MDWVGSVTTELPVLSGELVRAIPQNNNIHILSRSRWCEAGGTGVNCVEDPMARSDFTRGNTAGPVSPSSTGLASFLASLRARRSPHVVERNFRILISADGGAMVCDGGSIASERATRAPRTALSRRPTAGPPTGDGKVFPSRVHIVIPKCYTG